MISLSNLLISDAYADAGAPPPGGSLMEFLPLIALLAVFYFLVLRPQQKRAKEHRAMMEALQKGDEVLTVGGIMGRVIKVGETYASVEIADNVVVQVQKETIQSVLPKGTLRSAN